MSSQASLQAYASRLGMFARLVVREFGRHQAAQNAASLTFATLLSLVPLMTVSLAVLYAFPVADQVQDSIQDWLFSNFVPASSEALQAHLQAFSDKASRMSGAGFAFLVVVALMLMGNIDRTFNVIWGTRRPRRALVKFLVYWAVLTLGPLLIGVSVVATSYLVTLPFLSDAAASGVGRRLLGLMPVFTSTLAFSLMYAVIPNVRVRLRHALIGGLVAALLFEAAKRGFAAYITAFPTYEAIYGALAMVPIFLVWVYLSWMVTLIGAEVAHCLRLFNWQADNPHGRELGFADAIQALLYLDEAAGEGQALSARVLAARQADWREDLMEGLLSDLLSLHWVHQTDDGHWSLARRLADLSFSDVLHAGGYRVPSPEDRDWPHDERLKALFVAAVGERDKVLDVPLADFRLQRAETESIRAVPPGA